MVELGLKIMPPLPTSMEIVFAAIATARVKTETTEENIVCGVYFFCVCLIASVRLSKLRKDEQIQGLREVKRSI